MYVFNFSSIIFFNSTDARCRRRFCLSSVFGRCVFSQNKRTSHTVACSMLPFSVYFSYIVDDNAILMLFILHYFSVFGRFFSLVIFVARLLLFLYITCGVDSSDLFAPPSLLSLSSSFSCSFMFKLFLQYFVAMFLPPYENRRFDFGTKDRQMKLNVCVYWKQKATDNQSKKKHVFIFVSLYVCGVCECGRGLSLNYSNLIFCLHTKWTKDKTFGGRDESLDRKKKFFPSCPSTGCKAIKFMHCRKMSAWVETHTELYSSCCCVLFFFLPIRFLSSCAKANANILYLNLFIQKAFSAHVFHIGKAAAITYYITKHTHFMFDFSYLQTNETGKKKDCLPTTIRMANSFAI